MLKRGREKLMNEIKIFTITGNTNQTCNAHHLFHRKKNQSINPLNNYQQFFY